MDIIYFKKINTLKQKPIIFEKDTPNVAALNKQEVEQIRQLIG